MHPLNAPWSKWIINIVFQKYWHNVGNDIKKMVMNIINNNQDNAEINNTYIVLVPKRKNLTSPKDFRPISIYNVVMKMVTKTIANRVKHVLLETVNEEKNVLVKGRLITDNTLITMGCFYWMKKHKKEKKNYGHQAWYIKGIRHIRMWLCS